MAVSMKTLSHCQHLIRLYQDPVPQKEKSLEALPLQIQEKILHYFAALKPHPLLQESRYRETCLFESLPELQQAVFETALEIFGSLEKRERCFIKEKFVAKNTDFDSCREFSDRVALCNLEFLYVLDEEMESVQEIKTILANWVVEGNVQECMGKDVGNREEAQSRALFFLFTPGSSILNFSNLQLEQLPPIFDKEPFIEKIEGLNLSRNCLTVWPKEIAHLRNVQHLNLSCNQLREWPENLQDIGNFPKLQELNLSKNRFTTLPIDVCELKNLKVLDLAENQLESVPKQIGRLTNLVYLSLANNQISKLPGSICYLHYLRTLDLKYNLFTALPEEIEGLSNLLRLDLRHNQLTTLPKKIGALTELIYLFLEDNPLTALPKGVGKLRLLLSMNLTFDAFELFPEQLTLLPQCCINGQDPSLSSPSSLPFLRRQHASIVLSKIDSSVTHWTLSPEILEIDVDLAIHLRCSATSRLFDRVALALWDYRVDLLKPILIRQNPNEADMDNLKYIAIGELSHNLRPIYGGAQCHKFGHVDLQVQEKVGAAMATFTEEYKPIEYLFDNLTTPDGNLEHLHTEILLWVKKRYNFEEDFDRALSEDFETQPASEGGNLTKEGVCFLLHTLGIIDRADSGSSKTP